MACSKKDFVAVAKILAKVAAQQQWPHNAHRPIWSTVSEAIAHEMADYFASVNPLFDRERFLAACGVEQR